MVSTKLVWDAVLKAFVGSTNERHLGPSRRGQMERVERGVGRRPYPFGSGLQSRAALQVENAALRHQLAVLQRRARGRPRLRSVDPLFWAWLSTAATLVLGRDFPRRWGSYAASASTLRKDGAPMAKQTLTKKGKKAAKKTAEVRYLSSPALFKGVLPSRTPHKSFGSL